MSTVKRPPRRGNAPSDISLTYDGLPYKGKVRDYKENDPDDKLPQMGMEAHVDIFELNDKEQLKAYEAVVQKLVSDRAILSYEEKEYDQELKNWRILIVYTDLFYEEPSEDVK